MKQSDQLESKQAKSVIIRKLFKAISFGIWGAIIWSVFGFLIYWLNLTKLSPMHISKVIIKDNMLHQWQGLIISMLILIILSVIFSLIYVFLFSHVYTPWIGIGCGLIIWYALLGWRKMDMNTVSSTISLFVLYGAFIGYSLSVEFSSLEKKK